MLRINPVGRIPRTQRSTMTVRIGRGQSVHLLNPDTGLPLCMPASGAGKGRATTDRIRVTDAEQVNCMRCEKLMVINRQLRGDDLHIGDAKALVSAAAARRR